MNGEGPIFSCPMEISPACSLKRSACSSCFGVVLSWATLLQKEKVTHQVVFWDPGLMALTLLETYWKQGIYRQLLEFMLACQKEKIRELRAEIIRDSAKADLNDREHGN